MGVYIKGMNMPKGCHEKPHGYVCPYILYCKAYTRNKPPINKRPSDCPLIEVTEPHGRLIDADKLFGWYDGQREKYPIKKETPQYGTLMMYEIFDEIEDAPTVIEAEI